MKFPMLSRGTVVPFTVAVPPCGAVPETKNVPRLVVMLAGREGKSMRSGAMVSCVLPDFVGSATLVAVMVTVLGLGTMAGAVYVAVLAPVLEISPKAAFPFCTPFTDHVTELSGWPWLFTTAVSCRVAPA
jgi:hypothetical protein